MNGHGSLDIIVNRAVIKRSGDNDVLCRNGRGTHEKRPANKFYRSLLDAREESYNDSKLRDAV
jgi:hypothetical protein